ncbi:MAG: BamA/TamA family outer membrane protein, partial [Phaeodactylibacter sp.]|nr:BamA/TamA family outer membrane protein [Phaeodactylibacter sp.]
FEERASLFAQLPFSQTNRLEGGFGYSRIHYRIDRFTNYYDAFGSLVAQGREKLEAPEGFGYFNLNAAFVHDNSYFGIAAPLQGNRYRVGVEKYFGDLDFYSVIADYRHYLYVKPLTFAVRVMHLGRYGQDAERLTPLYLGNPWFLRGYGFSSSDILEANKISFDQLAGSKVLVGNFEVRLPFTGPERLSLIKSKFLLTDLNLFLDAGLAWSDLQDFEGNTGTIGIFGTGAQPLFSAGASMRLNLFGAMVLEPYYAFPLLKNTRGVFGLNIIPGW